MRGSKPHTRLLVAGALIFLLVGAPAWAKTYEPTRKDDPVPNGCKPSNCSLREAVVAANKHSGPDTIRLGKGTYKLTIPEGMFDANDSLTGDLDLEGAQIRGRGSRRTRISGEDVTRVLHLHGSSIDFSVRDLTIRNGLASGAGGVSGGAILASNHGGTLNLTKVVLAGNEAAEGGAIHSFAVDIAIKRSRLLQNEATYGGAIESTGTLTIKNSTIDGNTAAEGGGIDLRPAATAPVTRVLASTISRNIATNKAGGILADGNPFTGPDQPEEPELHIVNSTVAGNTADNDAGGIMGDNAATVDIENSSIGFNRANDDETDIAVAGGIYQHSNAIFSVDDSILANNDVGQGGSDPDCSATQVFSGAGNVISSTEGCDVSFTTPFNVYSASAIALALADNGGPTQTMKVPGGSAAIGFANTCPKRDQRGVKRPDNCDSGAFERKGP